MLTTRQGFRKVTVAIAIGSVTVLAAACSSSSSQPDHHGGSSTTASTVGLPTTVIPTQSTNAAIAATVPASVKSAGTITIAMDATYAPDEFIAPDGSTIVGMDADLATAISQVLGLKAKLVNATFDTIIPGIQSGKYDMGASSFTDTMARQKVVDFVDYFTAGEGFYVKTGSSLAFNGLSIAVRALGGRRGRDHRADRRPDPGQDLHHGGQEDGHRAVLRQPEPGQPGRLQRAGRRRVRRLAGGRLHRGHLQRRVPEQRHRLRGRPLRPGPAQGQRHGRTGAGRRQRPHRQRRLHQDPHQVGRAGRGGDSPRSSTAPPAEGPAAGPRSCR